MEELKNTIVTRKSLDNPSTMNKAKGVPIQELFIDPKVVDQLQLNVRNSRNKRREIARAYKINWKVYRILENEVTKRIQKGLNPSTGKSFEQKEKENDTIG